MRVKVFRSIKEVSADLWDKLISEDDIFLSHRYLTVVEESGLPDCEFWYLMVFKDDVIAATLPLFRMPIHLDLLSTGVVRKMIQGVRKLFSNFFVLRPLIAGSPPSLGNSNLVIGEDVDYKSVLSAITQKVEMIAKENRINLIVFKEFENSSTTDMDQLISLGYVKASSLPNNRLVLRGKSFEEFLKSMRKPYRQSIKASLKKLKKSEINVKILKNFEEEYGNYHYGLYEEVLSRSKSQLEKLPLDYFKKMPEQLDDKAAFIVLYKGDLALGYFLVCDSGKDSITAMFAGINYEYNREYHVYFNLFYQVIQMAYMKKKNIVEFGQNSYQFKSRVGCQQIDLFVYIKGLSRINHYIISKLNSFLFPKHQIETKNVFRERSEENYGV